jgi:glycosyltransferase involved in cell wall biosynthesis
VSTDVTGIPELVRDGATGLQVPQNDPPALAAALERLLDDPVLRDQLARQARHRIEEDFDVECNAAQLRAVFRESIAPAVQPPPLPALDALETFATPGMAGEVH